jgi:hypothetical protein
MPTTDWPPDAIVPPLPLRDGTTLSPLEIAGLLHLLRHELPAPVKPTLQDYHPPQPWRRAVLPQSLRGAFDTLRERCGDLALDAWMASLLRAWLQDIGTGTARKIRWVVPGAALLGGDACAALLGAHLRGENYDLRCTGEVGVDALLEMGTRGALLELAHLARKCPTSFRGELAHKALQDIAALQGLTPDQLQDRILPDCGLDARGRRSFDYGPRQFELVLDEYLTPLLRTSDGRRLTSLPKPTSKDDAARATEARQAWKIAKGQIQQTARSLAARFEAAMVSGETWSATEFNDNFRHHPLARHVVRRLLWTNAAPDGGATTYFRVAEDDTLANSDDAPIELANTGIAVRPVHPLDLESSLLETWQRLFAEYQIVSPFPQLDRQVFLLPATQAALRVLTTFPHDQFDVKALVFPLENRGWTRDGHADGGMVTKHSRQFPRHGVTACLEYTPGAFLGDIIGSGLQTLEKLYFVALGPHAGSAQALSIDQVPSIVMSETLRDIHALQPAA